jgi:inhibitor of KinA sporulation pathway (predicted exonuclease)
MNKGKMSEGDLFPSLSILGVCGSIGSGKSYACSLLTDKLKQLDISSYHLDTDSIAHSVYSPGSQAINEIAAEFGPSIITDGNVDRKALGAIVFSNPEMMRVSFFFNIYLFENSTLYNFTNLNRFFYV